MIIYGSRMYFKERQVKSFGECEHCGRFSKMTSYQARKFGHIYFIPLIPMGSKSQVLRECSKCDMGLHIPLASFGQLVSTVETQFKDWIGEVQNGNREIELPDAKGAKVNVGLLIAGILDDLYCLKLIETIEPISTILQSQGFDYENNIVLARWAEMCGDLNQAKGRMLAALQASPENSYPLYQMGRLELLSNNSQGAEAAFQRYIAVNPTDISANAMLAGIYERAKDYPKLIKSYDTLYSLNADLLGNSGMKKQYKTACKKSGIEGKYLMQLK